MVNEYGQPPLHGPEQHQLRSPLVIARELGEDLARSETSGMALWRMGMHFMELGCPDEIRPAETAPMAGYPDKPLAVGTPDFSHLVRIATRHIVWREEELDPETAHIPVIAAPGERTMFRDTGSKSTEDMIEETLEGAVWSSESDTAYRERVSTANANLLRVLTISLDRSGYSRAAAETDMRNELDDILDQLWRRGSYHTFPESRFIAMIMNKAGLRNATSWARTTRRVHGFSRNYGAHLAIIRMLPDKALQL